jgi:hypothetical protein
MNDGRITPLSAKIPWPTSFAYSKREQGRRMVSAVAKQKTATKPHMAQISRILDRDEISSIHIRSRCAGDGHSLP